MRGEIPWRVAVEGYRRIKRLLSSISIIEKGSGTPYPSIFIVPELRILIHEAEVGAVIHAHIDFKRREGVVEPIISLSLPFLNLGRKAALTAVLAHEFLHYLYLAKKFLESDFFTFQQSFGETVMGRLSLDEAVQIPAKAVFKSRYLIDLVAERFQSLINDDRLMRRIEDEWISKDLPVVKLDPGDLIVHLSASEFVNLKFPREIISRVSQL